MGGWEGFREGREGLGRKRGMDRGCEEGRRGRQGKPEKKQIKGGRGLWRDGGREVREMEGGREGEREGEGVEGWDRKTDGGTEGWGD